MRNIFLLLIGICALGLPPSAQAQWGSTCPNTTKSIELSTYPAISSHYVQRTLDRADNGIAYANSFTGLTTTRTYFFNWSTAIINTMYRMVDTGGRAVRQSRNVEESTTCLHIDLLLLESKMEEVRCNLENAFEDVNISGVIRLEEVMQFLEGRYNALNAGADSPSYEDTSWGRTRLFDPPSTLGWCLREDYSCSFMTKEQCTLADPFYVHFMTLRSCELQAGFNETGEGLSDISEFMCPFDSDYLPPTVSGYGCDLETLSPYSGMDPNYSTIASEYDGLEDLITERNAFITFAEPTKDQRLKLDTLLQRDPLNLQNFGTALDREHKEMFGCLEQNIDELNQISTETDPQPIETNIVYRNGGTITELRGPFSFSLNETKLMRRYIEKRRSWASHRRYADYLLRPHERYELGESPGEWIEASLGMLERIVRRYLRWYFLRWSIEQAERESLVAAKSQDGIAQVIDMFSEIRSTVKNMTELASKRNEGSRNFAKGMAWYLRRSCIERPCNEKLETILKIVLENSCFPYANGSYKSGDVYDTCKTDADL